MTKIPTQLHLFRPRSKTPTWKALPIDARKKAEALLARMLREHRARLLENRSRREEPDE